jgi:hypothetical protein
VIISPTAAQTNMDDHDNFLRERLPHPLGGLLRVNPQYYLLPSSALSLVSLLVFIGTIAGMQVTLSQRTLFELPFPPFIAALGALVVAAGVALFCRRRPTTLFPRLWVLVLTGLAFVSLFLAVIVDAPWVDVFAISALAAALMLLPRLLAPRPDSPLLNKIVLLALVIILLPLVLGLGQVHRMSVANENYEVDRLLARLNAHQKQVDAVSSMDWRGICVNPERGLTQAAFAKNLAISCCEGLLPNKKEWRRIELLGREEEVIHAYNGLLNSITALETNNEKEPRLSDLTQAPILERNKGIWERYPQLSPIGAAVIDYHQTSRNMLLELQPDKDDRPPQALVDSWTLAKQSHDHDLELLASSFADGWLVELIEPRPPALGAQHELSTVLHSAQMLYDPTGQKTAIPAADFAALMTMLGTWESASRLAEVSPGCVAGSYPTASGELHTSLECSSYRADASQHSVNPQFVVRVMWSGYQRKNRSVYMIVAAPPNKEVSAHLTDFMAALRDACAKLGAKVQYVDQNQRLDKGFIVSWNDVSYNVAVVKGKAREGKLALADGGPPVQRTFEINISR